MTHVRPPDRRTFSVFLVFLGAIGLMGFGVAHFKNFTGVAKTATAEKIQQALPNNQIGIASFIAVNTLSSNIAVTNSVGSPKFADNNRMQVAAPDWVAAMSHPPSLEQPFEHNTVAYNDSGGSSQQNIVGNMRANTLYGAQHMNC